MTRDQAVQRIWTHRVLAVVLIAVAIPVVFTALLKMLINQPPDPTGVITNLVDRIVSFVYYDIPVVSTIVSTLWEYPPTPSVPPLVSVDNVVFVVFYMMLFVAAALLGAARTLAQTVKEVDDEIRKENMRHSVKGESISTPKGDLLINPPAEASIWRRVHELYMAPVVVGIFLLLVGFYFKLD